MQLLTDKTKLLAILVNCRIDGNTLLCGAAVFRGGLSGEIEVFDGDKCLKIKIPDSVKDTHTHEIFSNANDNLEIDLCSQ